MRKSLGLLVGASIVLSGGQAMAMTYAGFRALVIVDAEKLLYEAGRYEFVPAINEMAEMMKDDGMNLSVKGINASLTSAESYCREIQGRNGLASRADLDALANQFLLRDLAKIDSGESRKKYPAFSDAESAAVSALVAAQYNRAITETCPELLK